MSPFPCPRHTCPSSSDASGQTHPRGCGESPRPGGERGERNTPRHPAELGKSGTAARFGRFPLICPNTQLILEHLPGEPSDLEGRPRAGSGLSHILPLYSSCQKRTGMRPHSSLLAFPADFLSYFILFFSFNSYFLPTPPQPHSRRQRRASGSVFWMLCTRRSPPLSPSPAPAHPGGEPGAPSPSPLPAKTRASRESKGCPGPLRGLRMLQIRPLGHRSRADGCRTTATGFAQRPGLRNTAPGPSPAAGTCRRHRILHHSGHPSSRHRFKKWHGSHKPQRPSPSPCSR